MEMTISIIGAILLIAMAVLVILRAFYKPKRQSKFLQYTFDEGRAIDDTGPIRHDKPPE